MKIRFWGTRGSIATPGPRTVRYGGNTSCVEVRADAGALLVLDAGTGLRELGTALVSAGEVPLEVDILLSHLHWDHREGIPFFKPAFDPGSRIHVRGPRQEHPISTLLNAGMTSHFFPVDFERLPASFDFHDLTAGEEVRLGAFTVRTAAVHHSAPTLAYRVEADGSSLVFATDTEDPFSGAENPIVALARGAHTLIHDAQYLPEDYKPGWGHSTMQAAVDVAVRAGVRRLVLTHHDPDRTDDALDAVFADAKRLAHGLAPGLEVRVAHEGLELGFR